MGRSVSYASGSVVKAYHYIEEQDDTGFWYADIKADLQEYARTLWPSLRPCHEWLGREDLALLENDLVYMGLSEYGGMVCYWIVPKDTERKALGEQWAWVISDKFCKTFGTLHKVGAFSNGETVYARIVKGV